MDVKTKGTGSVLPTSLSNQRATSTSSFNDEYILVKKIQQKTLKDSPEGRRTLGLETREARLQPRVESVRPALGSNQPVRLTTGDSTNNTTIEINGNNESISFVSADGLSTASRMRLREDPTADRALLIMRDELLRTRFRTMDKSNNSVRHFYTNQNATITTTETTFLLNNIPQDAAGVTNNERLSTVIKMLRLKIKLQLNMVQQNVSTVAIQAPMCRVVIWREYIPLVPGTPPTAFGTDAVLPASATLLFTRLGGAATGYNNILAMRNPITDCCYHVHSDKVYDLSSGGVQWVTTAATEFIGPKTHIAEYDIDLNGLEQNYSSTTASSFVDNALYITLINSDATNMGWAQGTVMFSDLVFIDGAQLQ